MPTWLRESGYRFGVYSSDCDEPPHVHVVGGRGSAKFWLGPVSLGATAGYNARDLVVVETIVRDHEQEFRERWREFCGKD